MEMRNLLGTGAKVTLYNHLIFFFFESDLLCHSGWTAVVDLTSLQSLPNFCIFSRVVFHHIGQAGLKLLTSGEICLPRSSKVLGLQV